MRLFSVLQFCKDVKIPTNKTEAASTCSNPLLICILGVSGSGKSTTIYHIIGSRVAQDSRILVTSIRNQAVDAVVTKVANFGVLVSFTSCRIQEAQNMYGLEASPQARPDQVRVCQREKLIKLENRGWMHQCPIGLLVHDFNIVSAVLGIDTLLPNMMCPTLCW